LFQGILYCLVFLICLAVLHKLHSRSARQVVLLAASYALYVTWGPWFAAILLASTLVNYVVGQWLRRSQSGAILSLGILLNLALLGSFKYLPEVAVHIPFASLQRFSHLVMPIGLSFWTFQAMSFLFDLYRDENLDPSFLEFAVYMVFFPVTVSGPICRMPDMLQQFRSDEPTRSDDVWLGLRRIATGAFMVQLAKLLEQGILGGDGISSGFDRLANWSGFDVWCLALGYGLQLFLDFAGYSHIAIGAAKALGFTVPENFARPFESTNASIFWTRWHMSLSFWIRDYVFLPLAMLRREVWWRNLALVFAMLLFGLWHKASVLFLLWGCYQGALLVLHRQIQQVQRKVDWDPPAHIWTPVSWLATMALINFGWVFFRATSLPQAQQMLMALVSPAGYASHFLSGSLYMLVAAIGAGYTITIFVTGAIDRYTDEPQTSESTANSGMIGFIARSRWYWLPPLYAVAMLFLLIVTLTRGASTAQFMYNKF